MRSLKLSLAFAGLLVMPVLAKADTFGFTLSGAGLNTSGTLTATPYSSGVYTINTISAPGITGVIGSNASVFSNDNFLFPGSARSLDVSGLGFTETLGGVSYAVNLYTALAYNPPSNVVFYADTYDLSGNFLSETPVSFTAYTPEPSSLVLLGTGAVGAVVQIRRRMLA